MNPNQSPSSSPPPFVPQEIQSEEVTVENSNSSPSEANQEFPDQLTPQQQQLQESPETSDKVRDDLGSAEHPGMEIEPETIRGEVVEYSESTESISEALPHIPRIEDDRYKKLETLSGHSRSITAVKFSPDGAFLASSSADASIKIWNLKDFKCERTIIGHQRGINDVSWNSRSLHIVSGSDDKTVRIFNVSDGKCLKHMTGHTNYVLSCVFNPQSSLVASAGFDETIRFWDVVKGLCLKSIPAHTNVITSISFNNTGSLIASSSYDGCIRIWDVMTGRCKKTFKDVCDKAITFVQFTPNGKFMLSSHVTSTHKMWEIADVKPKKYYTGHTNEQYFSQACMSFSHGNNIMSGSEDGKVYIWDINSRKVKHVLDDHSTTVLTVDAHPTLDMIASGGLEPDHVIRIWRSKE